MMGRLPALACLIGGGLVAAVSAEPIAFEHGPFALTFDAPSGSLVRLACNGQEIAKSLARLPAITFSVGPATNQLTWLEQMQPPPKLLKHERPAPDTIELTIAAGNYEWTERYRLSDNPPRLDRSLRLVNRSTETVKLRTVAFRLNGVRASGDGFYRFPKSWPPQSYRFAAMQPGQKHGGRSSIAPGLAQLGDGRTLLWASFTQDSPSCDVTEGTGTFDLRQVVQACGYLRPNEPQEIGFVTLEVLPGDYWSALAKLWDWMDSVGLRVPTNQPAWVREAILYSFHPGGTIGSNFTDLGGFEAATQKLLPTLPRLGVNAIWIMPVEYKSPYWPLDYYRFADGLGTGAQYKQLVARAHALGLKVLQDLVPHGGAPQAVHNVAHPEFMLRREDGSTLNYWLNDFALPAWQEFMAKVATHYVKEYDVDGYRVDAVSGSKEANWNEKIPYARASLAQLSGGLGMLRALRTAVQRAKPDGALLAEVESARHIGESDAVYDFAFCYTVCQDWRKRDAAEFVQLLQDYLEEQRLSEPRGAVRLRHVESHDSLRAQGWYGVRGMETFYALNAWIDGLPLLYHGMEVGHSAALARINQIRRRRPELSRGTAFYRAVKCDTPGVFTCLRQLGDAVSVVVINFNRDRVTANLTWSQGQDGIADFMKSAITVTLDPLGYTVLPEPPEWHGHPAHELAVLSILGQDAQATHEWTVETIEGRLSDRLDVLPPGSPKPRPSSIYWRPQGTNTWWSNEMIPPPLPEPAPHLDPFPASGERRLPSPLPKGEGQGEGSPVPTLRVVGPEYIISNRHYTVTLRRQGGVIRQLRTARGVVAENQDFYGDQAYFASTHASTLRASEDVETGIRVWREGSTLRLSFTGQIRGSNRFALKRPALLYRNEFTFTDAPRFTQRWAFRTEKDFHDQKAFLTFYVGRVAADQFDFGKQTGKITDGKARIAQTKGADLPTAIRFPGVLTLDNLSVPRETDCHLFLQGHALFLTLLDSPPSSMNADRWYEFSTDWNTEPLK